MNAYSILGWLLLIAGLCCWANVFHKLYLLFRTRILVVLPLDQPYINFIVEKKGGYAVWQEGPIFKQAPVTFSRPQIINTDLQKIVPLSASWGRASKNGFTRAASLAFYCELDAGHYCFEVSAGSSLNVVEDKILQSFIQHLPIKKAASHQYNFQIRESLTRQQRIFMFLSIFVGLFFFNIGLFTILKHTFGMAMEGALG